MHLMPCLRVGLPDRRVVGRSGAAHAPFHGIRCGTPFGTKSSIERVAAKLAGKHWMYQGKDRRIDALKMCGECRVIAVAEAEFDRSGAPARPKIRTTEDYLREREQQTQKGET